MTQTCVRQSDLGATKHTPMVRYPLVLLNPTINTTFSCGKFEKLMVVQQLVPGTTTGSFTLQTADLYDNLMTIPSDAAYAIHIAVCLSSQAGGFLKCFPKLVFWCTFPASRPNSSGKYGVGLHIAHEIDGCLGYK